jgi:hypothetical protein
MLKLKSNNIKDFPFEQYAQLNDSQCEDLAKTHFLTAHNSWMLPQIAAHYGNWDLVYRGGKIDSQATAKKNMTTPWDIGLWKVCTKLKRGSLVKSQINPEFASYSALVPLLLMGVKKFQGIKYSQWDIQENTLLVDKNLREAMFWQPDESTLEFVNLSDCEARCGLGSERLLELREQGLTVKSGPNKGVKQSPTSAWCLRGMQGTELAKAPKLVGTMLTQIWVAHPSLRTEYMILDPYNWDWMPPPLVASEIFKNESITVEEPKFTSELPWEVA